MLRTIALLLFAASAACVAFGYWGMFTQAGQRRFDEMDGIIPFASAVFGAVLAVGGGIAWYIARRTSKARS